MQNAHRSMSAVGKIGNNADIHPQKNIHTYTYILGYKYNEINTSEQGNRYIITSTIGTIHRKHSEEESVHNDTISIKFLETSKTLKKLYCLGT